MLYASLKSSLLSIWKWIVAAVAFILLKENRNRKSLWILLPVAIVSIVWRTGVNWLEIRSEASMLNVIMYSVLAGFVINLLVSEKLAKINRFLSLCLVLIIFGGVGSLEMYLYSDDFGSMLVVFSCAVAILVLSFLVARLISRRYNPVLFTLLTTGGIYTFSSILVVVLFFLEAAEYSVGIEEVIEYYVASLICFGLGVGFLLPFELFFFNNIFWKERFKKLFKYNDFPVGGSVSQVLAGGVGPVMEDLNLKGMDKISIDPISGK